MTHDFVSFTKSARNVPKSVKMRGEKLIKRSQKCRKVSKKQDFIVLVLLSAYAERVGVSRMQDLLTVPVLSQISYCNSASFET